MLRKDNKSAEVLSSAARPLKEVSIISHRHGGQGRRLRVTFDAFRADEILRIGMLKRGIGSGILETIGL